MNWYTGTCGGTLAGTGTTLVVTPTVTTTYWARWEVSAPCAYTTCASVTVTVNYRSDDPISATATNATICRGNTTSLHLNGGGGGTGEVVRWYEGSCGTGTGISFVGSGQDIVVNPSTTTTYYGRFYDPDPCGYYTACAPVTITVTDLTADVKVYLQGPFDCNNVLTGGKKMFNWLVQPDLYLPLTDPYGLGTTVSPNATTFFTVLHPDIVDWVWVGLRPASDRDATGSTSSLPWYVVGSTEFKILYKPVAGLLKQDGHIIGADGNALALPYAFAGTQYYIVVGHRNHMAVESSTDPTFGCSTSYDFTDDYTKAWSYNYGSLMPEVYLGGTSPQWWGMVAGDVGNPTSPSPLDGEGFIGASDWSLWYPNNGYLGYLNSDMNLDSSTDSFDPNTFWAPNYGRNTGVNLYVPLY